MTNIYLYLQDNLNPLVVFVYSFFCCEQTLDIGEKPLPLQGNNFTVRTSPGLIPSFSVAQKVVYQSFACSDPYLKYNQREEI